MRKKLKHTRIQTTPLLSIVETKKLKNLLSSEYKTPNNSQFSD